jgi:hypothetical protein
MTFKQSPEAFLKMPSAAPAVAMARLVADRSEAICQTDLLGFSGIGSELLSDCRMSSVLFLLLFCVF